jgi:2TM domain
MVGRHSNVSPALTEGIERVFEDTNLRLAKQQVAALKGFYIHLGVFVVVMSGLFIIDAATGPSWWVQWPFFGWGVGVLAHAAAVFWRAPTAIGKWEARKVAEAKRRLDERATLDPHEPSA